MENCVVAQAPAVMARRRLSRGLPLLTMTVFAACCGCGTISDTDTDQPTFCRDIAPIVFANCVPCHRPQGAAPFPLQTFADVRTHAQQIADVTSSRYMPPWLPGDSDHRFVGDRRLAKEQLDTLRAWADAGAPEGDPAHLPPAAKYDSEWYLGEPDLIVSMPQPYIRRASPTDSWRNFVLPVEIPATKYVRAYDVDPGNAPAVHHAAIAVDRNGAARQRDAADPEQGFDGMQDGIVTLGVTSEYADGPTLGWTPGKMPYDGGDETGWQINPGDDLILQLHMPSVGKDESIQARIALYFADKPPRRRLFSVLLSVRDIVIPPGEDRYLRELEFELPIDVQLLGIYPHAHYLCEEMHAFATSPGGSRQELLHIPRWDFDWQDDYRYEEPILLAKGTTLSLEYYYNNSTTNVRNPNNPPQRIVYGEQSTDAMGDLIFYLVPVRDEERPLLRQAYLKFQYQKSLQRYQQRLAADPDSPRANNAVAEAFLLLGQPAEAAVYFRRAIELGEEDARCFANLARALRQRGQLAESLAFQRQAVAKQPDNVRFRRELALGLQRAKQLNQAKAEYERILEIQPRDVMAHANLGMIWGQQRQLVESERHLRIALEESPDYVPAHVNIGETLRAQRRYEEAIKHLRQALELDPENKVARQNLRRTIETANAVNAD